MKRLLPSVVTAVAGGVVLGFVAGSVVPAGHAAEEGKSDTYRMLELFGDVFERVRSDYVEEVTDEELIEAAVEGMLAHLDPHSTFLNKSRFRDPERGGQVPHPSRRCEQQAAAADRRADADFR